MAEFRGMDGDQMTETAPIVAARPWERQPAEPGRWFARFENFLYAGPGRSVLAVYKAERGKAGKSVSVQKVPGAWSEAVVAWRWRERAEEFDRVERERRREADEAQYRKELEEHRNNCKALARSELSVAARLLALVEKRLKDLKPEELQAANLPNCLRSIAAITEAGLSAESQTLTVDQLVKQMIDAELAHTVA